MLLIFLFSSVPFNTSYPESQDGKKNIKRKEIIEQKGKTEKEKELKVTKSHHYVTNQN